eukprot:scaffold16191_cov69-Skeletonema_dohrnii-CCMP3373.AAC.4
MQDKAHPWTNASRTHSTNSCEQSVEPAQSLGQSFLWAREIGFVQRKGKDGRRRVMYTTTELHYDLMIALEFHFTNSPEEASRSALAKCIHSLGSITAQKTVESNSKSTRNDWAQCNCSKTAELRGCDL